MSAERGSYYVRLPEYIRSSTFRWTFTISAVFFAAAVALTTLVFHEVIASNKTRIDGTLIREIRNAAGGVGGVAILTLQRTAIKPAKSY